MSGRASEHFVNWKRRGRRQRMTISGPNILERMRRKCSRRDLGMPEYLKWLLTRSCLLILFPCSPIFWPVYTLPRSDFSCHVTEIRANRSLFLLVLCLCSLLYESGVQKSWISPCIWPRSDKTLRVLFFPVKRCCTEALGWHMSRTDNGRSRRGEEEKRMHQKEMKLRKAEWKKQKRESLQGSKDGRW